jgi:hypothetical protein
MRSRRKARLGAVVLGTVLVVLVAGPGAAQPFEVEVTAGPSDASFASGAQWGWWSPGKYAGWTGEMDDGFELVEGRMTLPGKEYSVFVAAERVPEARLLASTGPVGDGPGEEVAVSVEIEAYDLALAEHYALGDATRLSVWLGATYLQIDERRVTWPADGSAGDAVPEDAASRLWGVAGGADLVYPISDRLSLSGRVIGRWARGKRRARMLPPDLGQGETESARVELSDSTSRSMLGAEGGLAWTVSPMLRVEGGWRLRDWRLDDGPLAVDGPFVRVMLDL